MTYCACFILERTFSDRLREWIKGQITEQLLFALIQLYCVYGCTEKYVIVLFWFTKLPVLQEVQNKFGNDCCLFFASHYFIFWMFSETSTSVSTFMLEKQFWDVLAYKTVLCGQSSKRFEVCGKNWAYTVVQKTRLLLRFYITWTKVDQYQ